MRDRLKRTAVFLAFLIAAFCLTASAQVRERFPKPDFESGYTRPELSAPLPRAVVWEYVDIFVLVAALSLAVVFAHKARSRRMIFLLMVFSLAYFGFYRKGCVCAIGAVQNVSEALFTPAAVVPVSVIVFFILPLVAALFTGRTFCAAVCPLGAIQDAVILKPVRVPPWLANALSVFPAVYLGLAVLLAVTGAGYVICQYDPFIGFFRFGADFNMVLFGSSMLLLGTVVARPYCRFLCPYGVLLSWMSRLSRRHVRITPDECNNCRLCEESCPFGAIRKPVDPAPAAAKETDVKRLALLLALLPAVAAAGGWIGSRLEVPLSRLHPKVSLAETVLLDDAGRQPVVTDALKAFKASGKPTEELLAEAGVLRREFRAGGWILGGFVGLIIWTKLIGLFIRKRRSEYEMDRGACLSCGRCFAYCPYEQVRLGNMSPEEAQNLGRREIKPKQFRA